MLSSKPLGIPGASFGSTDLPDTLDPQDGPNTEACAQAIGKAIACFDIVVLNETTNVDRVSQILHAMETTSSACPNKPDLHSRIRSTFRLSTVRTLDVTWATYWLAGKVTLWLTWFTSSAI